MPSEARQQYLDEACGGDHALRQRVALLLRMQNEDPEFLESPAVPPTVALDLASLSIPPDTLIGPYKIRELLGEGGMGCVYVAEQQKPVRRKVALKVIKPGMDSRQLVARFQLERQALALMDHPNIAKGVRCRHDRRTASLFCDGTGLRSSDHRVLRRTQADNH